MKNTNLKLQDIDPNFVALHFNLNVFIEELNAFTFEAGSKEARKFEK